MDNMFFNPIIRSITITYINMCMAYAHQIKNHLTGQKNGNQQEYFVGAVLFGMTYVYSIVTFVVLVKYRDRLGEPVI